MIELLAQSASETAITGAAGITIGGATVVIVQALIKRGFRVSAQVGNGNGDSNGRDRPTPGFCAAHADFAAKLDERHDAIMLAISEVKQAIIRLHERIDLALDRSPPERPHSHPYDQCSG